MKQKKRKRIIAAAAAVLVYILLVVLLKHAEVQSGSQIRSGADALWFSLATVTTVGYGDMVPASTAGKVISIVFMLMSLGFLASVFSLAVSMVSGELLPKLYLFFNRGRDRFIFLSDNRESLILADSVAREYKDALIVIVTDDRRISVDAAHFVRISALPDSSECRGKSYAFAMGRDEAENLELAQSMAGSFDKFFCRTEKLSVSDFKAAELFCLGENIARRLWGAHPLNEGENRIVLIGGTKWLPQILEQALLVNCFAPGRITEYHIFGDDGSFLRIHRMLGEFCSVNELSSERDSLIFHSDSWQSDGELIRGCDRVIICADSETENADILGTLRKYYPGHYRVCCLRRSGITGAGIGETEFFGSDEELFTSDVVLRCRLIRAAIELNEIYNAAVPESAKPWTERSDYEKASNIAAADHLLTKLRILLPEDNVTELTQDNLRRAYERYIAQYPEKKTVFRETERRRWCRFMYINNWSYAEDGVKDTRAKRHPLLCGYELLSENEKAKDEFAWEAIGKLSEYEPYGGPEA